MDGIEIIGGLAGLMTTSAFLPQALKVYKTKDTGSISMTMYIIFVMGLMFWIAYGVLCHKLAIILPNIVTLIFASYILFVKLSGTKRS
jgi:MtN3 and saliva related transmembrane protein